MYLRLLYLYSYSINAVATWSFCSNWRFDYRNSKLLCQNTSSTPLIPPPHGEKPMKIAGVQQLKIFAEYYLRNASSG